MTGTVVMRPAIHRRRYLKNASPVPVTAWWNMELLRSQIEVDTRVCHSVAEAREDLARLRRLTSDVAARYGLAPIAASTHPFADWHMQQRTDGARFQLIARDMRSLSRRNLICGMHVHVGIEDDDLRVELMNQFTHYLPLLLALSTSSPFWRGGQYRTEVIPVDCIRWISSYRTARTFHELRRLQAQYSGFSGGRA